MKTTAQKRKEARDARAADPYAYQRSQEAKERKKAKPKKRPENVFLENTADGAVMRLGMYISTYQEYMDRDRDMILLDIHKMLRQLTAS